MKICLVTSGGGHLYQLWQLRKSWQKKSHFWVTINRTDAKSLLNKEKKYFAYFPESRNVINFFKNLRFAFIILRKEKPNVIISAGAGVAIPFFIVGKLFHIHTIFIEPIDFIQEPSLTGKIASFFVDLFLIQNPRQKRFFPQAKYWGSTV